jgi:hypothetical protein
MRPLAALLISGLMVLPTACNHAAPPETNAAVTQQESADVKTPSGGGTETTDKRSVPERPPAPENIRLGSAVPPAAADETRPHPRQQTTTPQGPVVLPQAGSSSTPAQ